MNVKPQTRDANEDIIVGGFSQEAIAESAGNGSFKEITVPTSMAQGCRGFKVETTDSTATHSYDFFYATHWSDVVGGSPMTVIRNGEYKAKCIAPGGSAGFFKAESGKTIRVTFVA